MLLNTNNTQMRSSASVEEIIGPNLKKINSNVYKLQHQMSVQFGCN